MRIRWISNVLKISKSLYCVVKLEVFFFFILPGVALCVRREDIRTVIVALKINLIAQGTPSNVTRNVAVQVTLFRKLSAVLTYELMPW